MDSLLDPEGDLTEIGFFLKQIQDKASFRKAHAMKPLINLFILKLCGDQRSKGWSNIFPIYF